MAAVSTSVHHLPMKAIDQSDDDPYSPTTRDTSTPDYQDEDRNIHASSFSIHNVLKKERDANSPEEKCDEERVDYESCTESLRAEISVDDASCCSDDTVLSVGNEVPNTFNSSAESASKSIPNSPGTPPPCLTSFKHIETHLNAISQLSQGLPQPLLLRPNPITPNPLMFLNQQQLIFQNQMLGETKPLLQNRLPLSMTTMTAQQNPLRQNPSRNYLSPKSDDERRDSLKFSIDNILKADFGRRITDPLKRKTVKRPSAKVAEAVKSVEECSTRLLDSRLSDSGDKVGAVDLTKSEEGGSTSASGGTKGPDGQMVWPAWVYCTRYSDRPSSGRSPRTRRPKKPPGDSDEKRPRTAFSGPQLARLKHEFAENRYLTERRRQALAAELGLAEAQIKIWFQNKRAKIKKASGQRNPLALQLMAQGLYNHSTVNESDEEEEISVT